MANINRVVLVGNLTRDPELRHTPSGTCGLQAPHRRQHAPEGWADRRVGRQAQLLRRHRLGQPGRELRAVPLEGPPGRRRRPARLARVGGAGRDEAPGGRDHRRHRPVPRQPPATTGRRPAAVRAGRRRRQANADFGAGGCRRRHPLLTRSSKDREDSERDARRRRKRPAPAGARTAQELLLLQGQGRRGRLQELQPAAPVRLREGQDPLAADHRRLPPPPAAGRGRGQARPRDGAAALRLRAMIDAGHPPPTSTRSACAARSSTSPRLRAQLPAPAKLAEHGDAGRVAELEKRDAPRPPRGAQRRAGAGDRRALGQTELRFDVKAGPTGVLFGSVTPTDIADELWAGARSASTGARSTSARRSSGSAATRSRSSSSRTSRRGADAGRPGGGELPPEEESPRGADRGRAEPAAGRGECEADVGSRSSSCRAPRRWRQRIERPSSRSPGARVEEPVEGDEDVPEALSGEADALRRRRGRGIGHERPSCPQACPPGCGNRSEDRTAKSPGDFQGCDHAGSFVGMMSASMWTMRGTCVPYACILAVFAPAPRLRKDGFHQAEICPSSPH